MKTLEELKARKNEVAASMCQIAANSGEILTEEMQTQYDALKKESDTLEKQIPMMESALIAQAQADAAQARGIPSIGRQVKPEQIQDPGIMNKLPATVRKWGALKCFRDDDSYRADVKAYRFGQFLRGAVLGSDKSRQWCFQNGVEIKGAMMEDNNSKGGFLVPGEFEPDLIRLVEERGVFRRESRVMPMSQDTKSVPRRTGGTTAYFIGEGTAITETDMTIDLVTLVAKKIGVLVPMSNELGDDAIISVADMLAQEIAYAFADKEDECGFNGDGTNDYGHITGIRQQLIQKALGGTAAGAVPAASGLVRYGTGYDYANLSMATLTQLIGKLPSYAEPNAKWYGSKFVWSYLLDLLADAGGNTMQTLASGVNKQFLGYPYIVTDVMPKVAATNQVCLLLGDLRMATTFGDRRRTSMAMSDSAYVGSTSMFETDQIAIRGTERFDINVHDVGSTTARGPVVGIITHTA
jgi:HK97 family phage major capsid protein